MNLPPPQLVLHSTDSKSWFKSRHLSKVKELYLKTAQERYDDQVLLKTFALIDRDQSSTLDIDELYVMFKKNGYPIQLHMLRKFFDQTDKDHNNHIDIDEFKHIVYDEQATKSFTHLMRRMRETGGENFYSTDFIKLLRYLSYCQSRFDLTLQVQNHRIPAQKRSMVLSQLMKLTEQFIDIKIPQSERRTSVKTKQHCSFRIKLNPLNEKLQPKSTISSLPTTITTLNLSASQHQISPFKTHRSHQQSNSYNETSVLGNSQRYTTKEV